MKDIVITRKPGPYDGPAAFSYELTAPSHGDIRYTVEPTRTSGDTIKWKLDDNDPGNYHARTYPSKSAAVRAAVTEIRGIMHNDRRNATPDIPNEMLERIIVHPKDLLLDNRNPRFIGDVFGHSWLMGRHPSDVDIHTPQLQEIIRRAIIEHHDAGRLMDSILEVGFLRLDPIIVVPEGDKYRVVEGNRRVTAIKTLLGEHKIRIKKLSDEVLANLEELEVVKLADGYDEAQVWTLLGIRHVSGVRAWGPYGQAELVRTLHERKGMTFIEIGKTVGISPAKASLSLKALYGLKQMMRDKEYGKKATPHLFSAFEQSYAQKPVRTWLGWHANTRRYADTANLRAFYRMLVDGTLRAVDVRDRLPVVLEHEEAKALFLSGKAGIDEAFSMAMTGRRFSKEITAAVSGFKGLLSKLDADSISTEDREAMSALRDQLDELLASNDVHLDIAI